MIIFSQHALLKLQQRGISKILVARVFESPDYEFNSYGSRNIVYKKFGKLYLKVIYTKEGHNIIVITEHWEENPRLIKWK